MRRSIVNLLLICGLMCCSCTLEDVLVYGSKCDAAYVVTAEGKCVYGKCSSYDIYFKDKICPQIAPMCIKDSDGVFYCGSQCPKKYHKVVPEEENGAECVADSKTKCGDDEVNCLKGSAHEGWVDALCNARHECEATRCQDSFYFTGNNCLTKAQCCGQFCQDCTRVKNKVCSGMDALAVCTDSCKDNEFECGGTCIDPMTSNTYCGSTDCSIHQCDKTQLCSDGECVCVDEGMVICEDGGKCVDVLSDVDNCESCGNKCSDTPGWFDGKCEDGQCVPEICESGYHLEIVDSGRACVEDSSDACGSQSIVCKENVNGWKSGRCENGRCVPEECTGDLVVFDNACSDPGDLCGDSVCKVNEVCEKGKCKCKDGYEVCDGFCYDLSQSIDHCGSCDNVCNVVNAENSCVDGECVFTCREGYVSRNGKTCKVRNCQDQTYMCDELDYKQCIEDEWTKVETCSTDIDNAEPVCSENVGCDYRCTDNYSMCDDKLCYNLRTDIEHCGDCSTSCSVQNAVNRCENGTCQFDCDSGFIRNKEGNGCVPFVCTTGAKRCEGFIPQICEDNEWKSQTACPTNIANALTTCVDAVCGYTCNPGFIDCSGNCVDLMTSTGNCGSCNHQCYQENASSSCSGGTCTYECNPGYDRTSSGCVLHVCDAGAVRCNGNSVQTCQDNTWVTTQSCSAPANATAGCDGKSCTWSCNNGYVQCGGGCYGASVSGMTITVATAYSSLGSGRTSSLGQYSKYSIYVKSGNYYAIYSDGLKYVSSSQLLVLPITGRISSTNGVNVRSGPSVNSDKVNALHAGICYGCNVTIDNYETGELSNGYGWFHIISNNGGTGPYNGYVSAEFVDRLTGSSDSNVPGCN